MRVQLGGQVVMVWGGGGGHIHYNCAHRLLNSTGMPWQVAGAVLEILCTIGQQNDITELSGSNFEQNQYL